MRSIGEWIRGHAIISVVIAFLLGLAIGGAGTVTSDGRSTALDESSEDVETVETPAEAEEEEEEPEPEPSFDNPTKDDFNLKIKKLNEECFGSAGCNTEIRVELTYKGSGDLDPLKTYELRYRIVGGEDALLSTIEVSGDSYTLDEHLMSTSTGAGLKAVVISVEEV